MQKRDEAGMDKTVLKYRKVIYNENTLMYTVKTGTGGNYKISTNRYLIYAKEYDNQKKSSVIAYILWLFLGIFGVHRFYVGDFFKGILLFFTLGGFIIGWLVDFVFLQKRIEEYNDALEIELLAKAIEDTQTDRNRGANIDNSVYDVRKEMDEDVDL
ncbi:TM2 domain-containing protein [uncultured Succiniclasticum sp.]|uniref:TM2 domain-containing protein n=1 Tax=uncultured Succiniclasticum sp. TaxID=1500547 RepID=UPI0025CC6826|nr:TM2 domain-containing protein [uncultured Succiniclasticum sp.]